MLDRFDAAAEILGLDAGMVRYLKTLGARISGAAGGAREATAVGKVVFR